ncbi:MAG: transcription elongation factor GreB [Fluviibacter sp.]
MNQSASTELRHYMTPGGHRRLCDELEYLVKTERPKIVEIVSWAASNGDRSENGDYLYGKKRLREIDRRIRFLMKRMENAHIIDPGLQQHRDQVFFGATVVVCDENGDETTYSIVGIDEADPAKGWISWVSPLAKALLKLREGDVARFASPLGDRELEVVEVIYQSLMVPPFTPET